MNSTELISLIALLEDDDREIVNHVESALLELGSEVIPVLENQWEFSKDAIHQQRIENVIHRIQFRKLKEEFKVWLHSEDQDLLHGVYLIAKYRFPSLDKQTLSNEIDKIRMDIWLEMQYDFTPFEKTRIINYVMYQVNGFKGNTENYHDPSNSFINQVLESKKGNPIMLAVVYILVTQRLNLPIFGVNLPQHFVLAYKEVDSTPDINTRFNQVQKVLNPKEGTVLFYINAFNGGAIFSKLNLEQFLKQISIEPKIEFFEPCSNLDIVKRVLRNLTAAYNKMDKKSKQKEIQELLFLLGEPDISHFDNITGIDDYQNEEED
ncbi:MAG: transglutaminase-like domain-containing protein [Bacteroidetes bacterium]|nr:transglutaminase-like domain-containing protein [Bacteroidota bacterium]